MNKKLKLWELNRVSEEDFKLQKKFPIIVILDSIRSLNNIGSFFRTSDAFNVEKILPEVLIGIVYDKSNMKLINIKGSDLILFFIYLFKTIFVIDIII